MGCRKDTRYRLLRLWMAAAVMVFGAVSAGYAQSYSNSWATKMFSDLGTSLTRNFGDIALRAEAEQRFKFRNIYKDDVVILSAQSSCSCTRVTVPNKVIKPGEVGEIIANVDTSGRVHVGRRKATITVHFSQPYAAEVQLQVSSNIRSDVVFDPGVVDFGGVTQGNLIAKTIYLKYSGSNPNWRIEKLKRNNPSIRAVSNLVSNQGGGKTYKLEVQLLATAEPGYINDLLQIITSESGSTGIFVPIHGLVHSTLSVKPTHLQLGVVHSNEVVTRNLVVRGSEPFKIADVSSDDSRISFKTAEQMSVVQVIPITFTVPAGEQPGEFKKSIRIKTTRDDLPELSVPVIGIISAESTENSESARTIVLPEEVESAVTAYHNFSGGPIIASFENVDLQTILSSCESIPVEKISPELTDVGEEPIFASVSNKFGRRFLTLQKLEETEDSDLLKSESAAESEKPEENSDLQVGTKTNTDEDGWFPVDEKSARRENNDQKSNKSKIAYQAPSFKRSEYSSLSK